MNEIIKKIVKYSLTLFIFTAIASGALAFTYASTKDRIERQKFLEKVKGALQAFPEAESSDWIKEREDLLEKVVEEFPETATVFEVNENGKKLGFVVEVLPKGYGGPVGTMVGISLDGEVTGVKVVDHKETPGLGSEVVENLKFLEKFTGKKPNDPVKIGKDVDAVTGATISSKAITNAIRQVLDIYQNILKKGE